MATSSAEVRNLFKCDICLERLQSPRGLPCLHTFCEACLKQHIRITKRLYSGVEEFMCPTCRRVTEIPEDGVDGFPKDFRINQFCDVLEKGNTCKNCDLCESSNTIAVKYCAECSKYFCRYCKIRHQLSPVLKTHALTDIVQNHGYGAMSTCQKHVSEPIKYFCKLCSVCVCVLCVFGEHEHHSLVSITNKRFKEEDELISCIKHVEAQISFIHRVIKELSSLERSKIRSFKDHGFKGTHRSQMLDKHVSSKHEVSDCEIPRNICYKYLEQFALILEKLQSLQTRHCDVLFTDYTFVLEEIQYIDVTHELSQIYPVRANDSDQYLISKRYLENRLSLDDVCSERHDSRGVKARQTRVGSPLDSCLTRLTKLSICRQPYFPSNYQRVVSSKPRFLFQVGGYGRGQGCLNLPFGIAFDRHEHLIVAENGSGQLQKFDIRGRSIEIIPLSAGYPRCITIGKHNEIYITDEHTRCIKEISKISQKTVIKTRDVYFPYGIMCLSDGNLVVSDKIYERISIFKPSGEKILQFGCHGNKDSCFDNPSYIATNGSNIYISDSGHHQIKVFDKNGNFIRKIGAFGSADFELRYPKGIAVNCRGDVIVADSGNNRVVMFSKLGDKTTTLLNSDDDIARPIDVACTTSGLLAVTMPDRHIVNVYRFQHFIV